MYDLLQNSITFKRLHKTGSLFFVEFIIVKTRFKKIFPNKLKASRFKYMNLSMVHVFFRQSEQS